MTWKRCLIALAAVISLAPAASPASAATPAQPLPKVSPGYDAQRQQAAEQLAHAQAELASIQREEADLDADAARTRSDVAAAQARAAAMARMLYVQPSSLLVQLAREPNPVASLEDAIDLQLVAAHAHDERDRITSLEARLAADQVRRQQASDHEARVRQTLQVALIQNAGIDVWGRARAWERANPDWKVDPPNPNHSKSALAAPLGSYALTQPYGPSVFWFEPPYAGYPHFHTGLDMSAPHGTPVQAADDGVVIATGYDGYGYGNYVVLGHPHARATLYAHLAQATVRAGDKVAQGQQVGLVGTTGNSTGPHLHFEVLVEGLPVDPAPLLLQPSGGDS